MARQSVVVNRSDVNGGGPPPSTFAAQLVHNQTRQDISQQRQSETATFAGLLHEILHNPAAVPETDIQVNTQLILVVVEAGFTVLAQDNPFAQWDLLIVQARDSMAVIKATIQRQPQILLSTLTSDGPPLFLWLLAKIVPVAGYPKCVELPIGRFLEAMVNALQSSLQHWLQAESLRQTLKDCVDDTISALEASSDQDAELKLQIPPSRNIKNIWRQAEGAILMPPGFQTSVTNPIRAFMSALAVAGSGCVAGVWADEAHSRLCRLFDTMQGHLQKQSLADRALGWLLQSSPYKAQVGLIQVFLSRIESATPSKHIQKQVAATLLDILAIDGSGEQSVLLPSIKAALQLSKDTNLHQDMKTAMASWIKYLSFSKEPSISENGAITAASSSNVRSDAATEHNGSLRLDGGFLTRRTRQRRKDRQRQRKTRFSPNVEADVSLKPLTTDNELSVLLEIDEFRYCALEEDQKCEAWDSLANFAIAEPTKVAKTVTRLISSRVDESKQCRVRSMLAVEQCLRHGADDKFFDLATAQIGEFCLRSLQSSIRELRVAANRCLSQFLKPTLKPENLQRNRQIVIEIIGTFSARKAENKDEIVISMWAQIALTSNGQELNLALLSLVDYLGHANPYVCGLAFQELEALCTTKQCSVEELLNPFWKSIAISVVQDLVRNPQKAHQLCDLLHVDVNTFLLQTQQATIPVLVVTKKMDVLQKIATTLRGPNAKIQDICLQPPSNLAATISHLLSQPSTDVEEAVMDCLGDVAPALRGSDLATMVKADSTLIAIDMLKHAAEVSDNRKSRAYQAFQIFANLAEREPGKRKAHSSASKTVTDFFEKHILGLLTHFSTVLESSNSLSGAEKSFNLKALREMIHIARSNCGIALPQIRACLQSAIDQTELCEDAFEAWLSLLSVLQSDDIAAIIDQTFAVIVRHWNQLSAITQQHVHEAIAQVIRGHNSVLREHVSTLPSLSSIPLLSKFASEFERLKAAESVESFCRAFTERLLDESSSVSIQALQELVPFLVEHQDFIQETAASEQPSAFLADLLRALLDTTAKYASSSLSIADLLGKCLGIIGCLDANRIDVMKNKRRVIVLSNFDKASEVVDWVCTLLEEVLVRAFRSVSNARSQGFLAYVMQELLRFCGFNDAQALRLRASQSRPTLQRWYEIPEPTRITLTPFLSSRYLLKSNANAAGSNRAYPSFQANSGHGTWLRGLVFDLTWKAKGDNAKMVFPLLAKIVRGNDLAISSFLLPYVVLNVVLGGTVAEVQGLSEELLAVLKAEPQSNSQSETIKLCSENVFEVLDYMSLWLQEKRKLLGETRSNAYKTGQSPADFDEIQDMNQIENLEKFLATIPAEVIAARAVDCGSYARALSHWEQYIRLERPLLPSSTSTRHDEFLYDRLQEIYAHIDEPDGLGGIAAHMSFVSEDQQAVQHARAGRWTAAQAWYEVQLATPTVSSADSTSDFKMSLLECLRETGQHAALLRYTDTFSTQERLENQDPHSLSRLGSFAVESYWMIRDFKGLERCLESLPKEASSEFNIGIARILSFAAKNDLTSLSDQIKALRQLSVANVTTSDVSSLQSCHEDLKKLHVLEEIEALSKCEGNDLSISKISATFEKRLAAVGSYISDKQYILGIRRAMMGTQSTQTIQGEIAGAWLTTARLARKAGNTTSAHHAVLQAYSCGERAAKLEEARLLWHDGHRRQAIQSLDTAIASRVFDLPEQIEVEGQTMSTGRSPYDNMLAAKAQLLLAKWLDAAGQSQAKDMTIRYQTAAKTFQRWEKGHYYLGKHYSKLLDAEKSLPKDKQGLLLTTGELTKLVMENLLRSVPWGSKYWHESIPKLLTLWLDLGMQCVQRQPREDAAVFEKRTQSLNDCHRQFVKYFDRRIPPYVFYNAIPQIISRISHPHPEVWKHLSTVLTRIGANHPSQTLWSLMAVAKARDRTRAERGTEVLSRLKDPKTKTRSEGLNNDLRVMINQGQRLSDGLLHACEAHVEPRASRANLFRDLGFNPKLAPSNLVVPVELTLTPSVPHNPTADRIRRHKAFVQEKITIQSFQEEVLVLSSLQRPRKITARGSDGKTYGLLCKPKDDLRKDQRLMEFNGMINRALKRDAESSKRRLYIKTYAVTPLSEESGIIEWVEGIKPIRDILLGLYHRKGIKPNYNDIRNLLNEACKGPEHTHIFEEKVLGMFKPALHEWFTETFAEPEAWCAARLRYARSAAVMSMTGHVLGLGDRHGENILLQEGTGGVFHVDFNCLFDKGLTFEKPEVVPFRLTPNMVDAMGPYGYDGPFRKSCELTLGLLRQHKDTLMTILETFLYDPTTDFIGGKKKRSTSGVPETPQEILDSVDGKLKGLLRGETMPLSVEGYVDALIREAVNPYNLAQMYIGWCSFL